jgi:hypothetical protein
LFVIFVLLNIDTSRISAWCTWLEIHKARAPNLQSKAIPLT